MSWVIKHNPKTLDEVIYPSVLGRTLIQKLVVTRSLPLYGLLLYGAGGSGKTTTVDLIAKELGGMDIELEDIGEPKSRLKTIESTIDNINQCSGEKVIVVGNEISKSSVNFREGLRGVMDRTSGKAIFLFTDNDYPKLCSENPQVWNGQRVTCVNWDTLPKEDIKALIVGILHKEGCATKENLEIATDMVAVGHPSIRKIIADTEVFINKD